MAQLFQALLAPGVPVVLSAVTPPGAKELPWDKWHCGHLGPHRHSAPLGCRVEGEALAAWSKDISKPWKRTHSAAWNACKRWVAHAHAADGGHDAHLRRPRQLWAVRRGLIPPPEWSGVELARVVALAGPWPVRGP